MSNYHLNNKISVRPRFGEAAFFCVAMSASKSGLRKGALFWTLFWARKKVSRKNIRDRLPDNLNHEKKAHGRELKLS